MCRTYSCTELGGSALPERSRLRLARNLFRRDIDNIQHDNEWCIPAHIWLTVLTDDQTKKQCNPLAAVILSRFLCRCAKLQLNNGSIAVHLHLCTWYVRIRSLHCSHTIVCMCLWGQNVCMICVMSMWQFGGHSCDLNVSGKYTGHSTAFAPQALSIPDRCSLSEAADIWYVTCTIH